MIKPVPDSVLDQLKAALGDGGWSADPDRLAPKLVEWRDRWRGTTPLLALPTTTEQVAAVVRICAAAGVAITPQGGNTGLVGGQIPQGEILLSLERMRAIRDLDVFDDVIEVEAGAPLASVQQAAHDAGRFFPVSLASEGTASIGGLISTNAGGVGVLRYGTMRAQVLGLEAVLPNGEVWNGLRRLRKDNTGYDLKQLLIAAEGTLGVITAAALKLYPIMASRAVAFVGLRTPQAAIELLARAKGETGGGLEAFELISALGLELVCRNIPDQRLPIGGEHAWAVLLETASSEAGAAEAAVERLLAKALEDDLIQDAAVAQSEAQAHAFWALRENQSAAQKPEGPCWKHDIAVPVSRIPAFLQRAGAAMQAVEPGVRIAAFGHVGDGNVHYDVLGAPGLAPEAHAALRDEAARRVYDIVAELDGSISAEHGLGIMKADEALRLKPAAEVEALRAIRAALDPGRIMNPRVLF
ncbi:FAD-binding oxidoreductase [Phenylobacterium montanum]|uniref:FAD-binding oxidoreductase n=1 Tax=Phenylobacterium montanum TaxID=2823693 RepID=A0A975FYQ4_9CAUL|nr:FAD-binding oxidoreductase [Caulobacter sp. S6]QUD87308.1 FAD-binding oxidoreductase [Caulobacter sp. S6]